MYNTVSYIGIWSTCFVIQLLESAVSHLARAANDLIPLSALQGPYVPRFSVLTLHPLALFTLFKFHINRSSYTSASHQPYLIIDLPLKTSYDPCHVH
jgi:hypothetical protein